MLNPPRTRCQGDITNLPGHREPRNDTTTTTTTTFFFPSLQPLLKFLFRFVCERAPCSCWMATQRPALTGRSRPHSTMEGNGIAAELNFYHVRMFVLSLKIIRCMDSTLHTKIISCLRTRTQLAQINYTCLAQFSGRLIPSFV